MSAFPHTPTELAQSILDALAKNNVKEAVKKAFFFVSKYGVLNTESYVLCAIALERAGKLEAALAHWEIVINRTPHYPERLARALRTAWKADPICHERVAKYAKEWLALLERIFLAAPDPALLAELTQRGWKGIGCAGIHEEMVHAWFWLDVKDRPKIILSQGGPQLAVKDVHTSVVNNAHVLYDLKIPLPEWDSPFFLNLMDGQGRHLQGSPICCFPAKDSTKKTTTTAQKTANPNLTSNFTSSKKSFLRTKKSNEPSITIIMPVYGDRKATLTCLGSLFASQKHNKIRNTILVCWDHGSDQKLYAILRRFAEMGKIVLKETPVNCGFLGCVNHALSFVPDGDVILLNSDTLVHGDWIDRLAKATQAPDAATVTALGSYAELMSFPSYYDRGSVEKLWQVALLDEACHELSEKESLKEIPTGVGFCMAITRRALRLLGGFDGRFVFSGYSEEVDFCLRAAKAGLKNYGAANLFVAHLGGRSFGSAKKALAIQNNLAIHQRYPQHQTDYDNFLREAPLRSAKEKISKKLCSALPKNTLLSLCTWTDQYLPEYKNLDNSHEDAEKDNSALGTNEFVPEKKLMTALFVRQNGEFCEALLRIRHWKLPLADMHFSLPQEKKSLQEVIQKCAFAGIKPICKAESIADLLNLPLVQEDTAQNADAENQKFLEKEADFRVNSWANFSAVGSVLSKADASWTQNFFVTPPRNITSWQKLCDLARKTPSACFYVYQLRRFWADSPKPTNLLELPMVDNLELLTPTACLLIDTDSAQLWQKWLNDHGCPDLPIFSAEVVSLWMR